MLWLGHVLFWLVVHLPRISNIYALCGERQFVKIVRARHIKASKFILVASLSTHNPPTKRGISIFRHGIWDPETSNYPNSDNSTKICFFCKTMRRWLEVFGQERHRSQECRRWTVEMQGRPLFFWFSSSLGKVEIHLRSTVKEKSPLTWKEKGQLDPPTIEIDVKKKILKNKCWIKPGMVH